MSFITRADLENAKQDADTIAEVVNEGADFNTDGTVTSREGQTLKTLAKIESDLENATSRATADAEAAKTAAETAETNAQTAATNAASRAREAQASADTATTQATNAAASATEAAASAASIQAGEVMSDDTLTGDGTASSKLSVANPFTAGDESKLDGIEDNATADQTPGEIVSGLEGLRGDSRLDASAVKNLPGGGGGGGGLSTVASDDTLTGTGAESDPLKVASPFTTAEKTKLLGIEIGAEVNINADWDATQGDAQILNKPGNASTTEDGLMTSADKTKLDSLTEGGEPNVNADWDATSGDAQILNKPGNASTTEDGLMTSEDKTKLDGIEDNATADQTPAEVVTGLQGLTGDARLDASAIKGLSSSGQGLQTVNSDDTLTGSGTDGSPLGVKRPFTELNEERLDGIEAGAQVNVNADWDETDTDSDAFIQNKPTIPTIPGDATTATAGLMSTADKTKLDGIEDNATADQTPAEVVSGLEGLTGDARLAASAIKDLPEGGGLATVASDSTLSGDGSEAKPLSVENPIVARGQYDASTAYIKGDAVIFNGQSYLARIPGTGVEPGTNAFPPSEPVTGSGTIEDPYILSEYDTEIDVAAQLSQHTQGNRVYFDIRDIAPGSWTFTLDTEPTGRNYSSRIRSYTGESLHTRNLDQSVTRTDTPTPHTLTISVADNVTFLELRLGDETVAAESEVKITIDAPDTAKQPYWDLIAVETAFTAADKTKLDSLDQADLPRNIRIGRTAATTFTTTISKDTGMVLNPADVDNADKIEFIIYDDEDTAFVATDGVRWKGLTDLSTDAQPTMSDGTFIEAKDETLGTFKIGRRATGAVFVQASTTGQVSVVGYRISSNATSVGRKLVGTSITGMTTRYSFAFADSDIILDPDKLYFLQLDDTRASIPGEDYLLLPDNLPTRVEGANATGRGRRLIHREDLDLFVAKTRGNRLLVGAEVPTTTAFFRLYEAVSGVKGDKGDRGDTGPVGGGPTLIFDSGDRRFSTSAIRSRGVTLPVAIRWRPERIVTFETLDRDLEDTDILTLLIKVAGQPASFVTTYGALKNIFPWDNYGFLNQGIPIATSPSYPGDSFDFFYLMRYEFSSTAFPASPFPASQNGLTAMFAGSFTNNDRVYSVQIWKMNGTSRGSDTTIVSTDDTLNGNGRIAEPLSVANPVPTDGTDGQVLGRTEDGTAWIDPPTTSATMPLGSGEEIFNAFTFATDENVPLLDDGLYRLAVRHGTGSRQTTFSFLFHGRELFQLPDVAPHVHQDIDDGAPGINRVPEDGRYAYTEPGGRVWQFVKASGGELAWAWPDAPRISSGSRAGHFGDVSAECFLELLGSQGLPDSIEAVATDDTLTGTGTESDELSVAMPVPTDGEEGQILSRTATGSEWVAAPRGGAGAFTVGRGTDPIYNVFTFTLDDETYVLDDNTLYRLAIRYGTGANIDDFSVLFHGRDLPTHADAPPHVQDTNGPGIVQFAEADRFPYTRNGRTWQFAKAHTGQLAWAWPDATSDGQGGFGDRTTSCELEIIGSGGLPDPLTAVATDDTLTGDGTSDSQLSVAMPVPADGTTGQVLGRTDTGSAWTDVTVETDGTLTGDGTAGDTLKVAIPVPSGGDDGQVLGRTDTGYEWANVISVPSGGTDGQILKRTATGYEWADAPSGGGGGGWTELGYESNYTVHQYSGSSTYANIDTGIDIADIADSDLIYIQFGNDTLFLRGSEWKALGGVATNTSGRDLTRASHILLNLSPETRLLRGSDGSVLIFVLGGNTSGSLLIGKWT